MRIIGGNFKGKRILEPKDIQTRPLKDLTKESIFNIIQHTNKFSVNFQKAEILDLFSGTGSFGIECLSRNAKFVTFVENYSGILPILKKNLSNLHLIDNYKIIEKDIFDNLNLNILKKKFNIIFLDPPYKENNLNSIVKSIIDLKILKHDGIMIIHRHKKHKDDFANNLKIIEEKVYGISKIIFGTYLN